MSLLETRNLNKHFGGLHVTAAELEEFKELAEEVGAAPLVPM